MVPIAGGLPALWGFSPGAKELLPGEGILFENSSSSGREKRPPLGGVYSHSWTVVAVWTGRACFRSSPDMAAPLFWLFSGKEKFYPRYGTRAAVYSGARFSSAFSLVEGQIRDS